MTRTSLALLALAYAVGSAVGVPTPNGTFFASSNQDQELWSFIKKNVGPYFIVFPVVRSAYNGPFSDQDSCRAC
jgi:hypothetical protein